MRTLFCLSLLALAMSACVNSTVDDHENHLEPYGLVLVNGTDSLHFYNADVEHGIAERSDTMRLNTAQAVKWNVRLATAEGIVAPDTTDTDHAFVIKSSSKTYARFVAGNWSLSANPQSTGTGTLELQINHEGHVDFVISKAIVVEVR